MARNNNGFLLESHTTLVSRYLSLSSLERESPAAYRAFLDYVMMGTERSLTKLESLYRSSSEPTPTKHLRTLKQWSADHHWQERLKHNAKMIESIQQKVNVRDLRELVQIFATLAKDIRSALGLPSGVDVTSGGQPLDTKHYIGWSPDNWDNSDDPTP